MLENDKPFEENNKARKGNKNDRYQHAGSKGCNLKECLLKTSMRRWVFFRETNKGSEEKEKNKTCVDFWEKNIP